MPSPKTVVPRIYNLNTPVDGLPGVASVKPRWWPSVTDHSAETTLAATDHIVCDCYSAANAGGTLLGQCSIDMASPVSASYGASMDTILRSAFG
jgi:hypothetical protein